MLRELHHSDAQVVAGGDPGVAALAERQGGVVSVAQLAGLGLGRGAIGLRVRRGRLHQVHRGVYAVGHRLLPFRGQLWAAVLACGGPEAAVVSHRSAAAVWDLRAAAGPSVDVTTLRRSRPRPGIRVHTARDLVPARDLITQADGLPVTTPTRTLIDLARCLSPHQVERLCHRAEILRLLDARSLRAARNPRLRKALATLAEADPQITRSELEERFLAIVADAGLPRPLVNAMVEGFEVDFWWPEQRLAIETDGAATHLTRTAFQRDRHRDAVLTVAAIRVVRFTRADVVHRPRRVRIALIRLHSVK